MENTSMNTICIVRAGFWGAQIGLHCAVYGYATCRVCSPSRASISLAAEWDMYQFGAAVMVQYLQWCGCGSPWDLEATPNFAAI